MVAVWATELGFADPSAMDIDSTVQEANIAYPSDAHLMVKMTFLVHKVWTYMKQNISFFADFIPCVDVKAVKTKARAYLFRDRKEPEHAIFQQLQISHQRPLMPDASLTDKRGGTETSAYPQRKEEHPAMIPLPTACPTCKAPGILYSVGVIRSAFPRVGECGGLGAGSEGTVSFAEHCGCRDVAAHATMGERLVDQCVASPGGGRLKRGYRWLPFLLVNEKWKPPISSFESTAARACHTQKRISVASIPPCQ